MILFLKVYLQASYWARNKPKVFLKVKPEPGPNPSPTRKARPDLQLCVRQQFRINEIGKAIMPPVSLSKYRRKISS